MKPELCHRTAWGSRFRSWAGCLRFCHLDDFLVDAAGTVTGFGEVGGVGKGLAEGFAGVGDLAAGAFGVGEGGGFAFFESVQAAFQAGDQADRVGVSQVGGGDADVGAGGAVEGQGDSGAAERALSGRGEREATEVASRVVVPRKPSTLVSPWRRSPSGARRRPRAWRKYARRRSVLQTPLA